MVISMIVFFALLVGIVVLIIKSWNKGMSARQANAEAQRQRHGGQSVLEWDGPKAQGPADSEFGPLVVEIPKKSGKDSVRFYERGFVMGNKRVGYDNLRDVAFIPGSGGGFTPKQKMRNSSVLWLYQKKGSTIGIRDLSYRFDKQTMQNIQDGLGFKNG